MNTEGWIVTYSVSEIDEEDAVRFDHGDRTFAIYRTSRSEFFVTDGYCTHEKFHLAGGLVSGDIIECPKHNGQLNFKTGEPKRAPICKKINTYPVKVEGGKVFIKID
ncbi:Rieske 2Fe-2S domain-containing protein [Paenibacillus frigoriresistens]|uniref:MocE family 2Fe-2S type ferredoxin n=1 Tax=Paenibacillus alginolyticus TaxID=59839 RepID=UPI001565CA07|nr:MocE family 2Fe-2S type ferredoxin [Paenibacillus frigoriresistens]NRF95903.1 Rieske 2Fe-2S domain-containing protein [Paenibacillus frigoriresistens]